MSKESNSTITKGGTIALLNLPSHTVLSLDASASQTLQNDEHMLAITNIHSQTGCHLLVVRGGGNVNSPTYNGATLHAIGVLILYPRDKNEHDHGHGNEHGNEHGWFVARKFDPMTEEISSELLDEISNDNLQKAIETNNYYNSNNNKGKNNNNTNGMNINSSRIIPHCRLFAAQGGQKGATTNSTTNSTTTNSKPHDEIWSNYLTNFISMDVLSKHGLTGKGDKIVPGTFSEEDDNINNSNCKSKSNNSNNNNNNNNGLDTRTNQKEEDGHTLSYPPIPHININTSGTGSQSTNMSTSTGSSINSHSGTRRFLASLTPTERTSLFLAIRASSSSSSNSNSNSNSNSYKQKNNESHEDIIFDTVLSTYYDENWKILLGQFQLSFILFLCCSCLSSLEHWRDTIQMMSLVEPITLISYSELFEHFLIALKYQLFSFDSNFFSDQEILDGNFLIPALQRLCYQCKNQSQSQNLKTIAMQLLQDIHSCVPELASYDETENNIFVNCDDGGGSGDDGGDGDGDYQGVDSVMNEDDSDEDGPIVVPMDEITASMERSSRLGQTITASAETATATSTLMDYKSDKQHNKQHSLKYPFLFASMRDGEDIIMTCARILDEKQDVTAVREAAAYLEEVEALS